MSNEEHLWTDLRRWLSTDDAGKGILRQLEHDDSGALEALRHWLHNHSETPPSTLATFVTGGHVEKLVNIAQAGLVLVTTLQKTAPVLSLPRLALSDRTRLNFAARRTQLVGREAEFADLDRFLAVEQPFRWWLLVGPAGVGKSRLALDFCIEKSVSWECGFLARASSFQDWRDWQPSKPTLIVVDYAADRAEQMRAAILALAERQKGEKIRLLLLEREAGDYWWKTFVGYGKESYVLEDSSYADPRAVPPLTKESVERIVQQLIDPAVFKENNQLLDELHAMAFLDRPLFAALAADAINAGKDPRRWDEQRLVRDVVEREIHLRWLPAGIKTSDLQTLLLATMIGGLPTSIVWSGKYAESIVPASNFDPKLYEMATGGSPRHMIEPVEPDIVGEFFVLQQLGPEGEFSERRPLLINAAWSIAPEEVASFLSRADADFPEHTTTPLLLHELPADPVQQYYWIWPAKSALERLRERKSLSLALELAYQILKCNFAHPDEKPMREHYGDDVYESFFNIPEGNIVLQRGPDAYSLALHLSDLRKAVGYQLRMLINELSDNQHLDRAKDLTSSYEKWVSWHLYDRQSVEQYVWAAFELITDCYEADDVENSIAWYRHVSEIAEARPKDEAVWDARQKGLVNLISFLCDKSYRSEALSFWNELSRIYIERSEDMSLGERVREAAGTLSTSFGTERDFKGADRLLRELAKLASKRKTPAILASIAEATSNIASHLALAGNFDSAYAKLSVLRELHGEDEVEGYLRSVQAITASNLIFVLYDTRTLNEMNSLYFEIRKLDEDGMASQSLAAFRSNALIQWLCTCYRADDLNALKQAYAEADAFATTNPEGLPIKAAGAFLLSAIMLRNAQSNRRAEPTAHFPQTLENDAWNLLMQALGIAETATVRNLVQAELS